jgi:putative lipoic acid-binding regulatory protein
LKTKTKIKMKNEEKTSLLEFPCSFPIKAMGKNSDDFEQLVSGIVLAHAELWSDQPIRSVASKEGNYISITAVIKAESQEQLDTIYQELTDCEQVKIAL